MRRWGLVRVDTSHPMPASVEMYVETFISKRGLCVFFLGCDSSKLSTRMDGFSKKFQRGLFYLLTLQSLLCCVRRREL